MDKFPLLVIATALYWIACLIIGVYASKTKVKKPSDYFLAGGGLGTIVVSFAMMATVFSAWFILGHQGSLWANGAKYLVHFIHIPLMGVMSAMLFPRIWAIARKNEYITMAEMYGSYWSSELLRVLVVIVGALYAVPYVALQLRGAGLTFEVLSGGKIPAAKGAIVLGIVVVLYVFLGGLKAAAITDTLQGALLVLASILLGATAVGAIMQLNPDISFFQAFGNGIKSAGDGYLTLGKLGEIWSWPYIATIAITTMGIYTSPPYMMLVASAKSPKVFKFQGFIIMTIVMGAMYYIFSALVGMGGRSIITKLASSDQLSLELVFNHMGAVPFLITSLGILAAMNSTAAGYLANTSTILSRDLYTRYINPNASAKKQVFVGRMMVLGIVAVSVVFSLVVLDYLVMIGTLATAFGIQLLPAMIGITFVRKISKTGINAGIICGSITVALTYFVWPHPLGIHQGGWGLLVNIICVVVGSILTQAPGKEALKKTHALFDKTVLEDNN